MFKDERKMFTLKTEVVAHLQWVIIFFKVLNKQFVKNGAPQFQNFRMNFPKFHGLFSTILSQLR
jgi:hypothetical protein